MSNELTLTASVSLYKAAIMANADALSVTGETATVTGNFRVKDTMSVTTSALAVPLGSVTSPGFAVFHNLDATNYVTLFNGASGAVFARLLGGDTAMSWAFVPLDPTCVPYAQANTAACLMEYMIVSQ